MSELPYALRWQEVPPETAKSRPSRLGAGHDDTREETFPNRASRDAYPKYRLAGL